MAYRGELPEGGRASGVEDELRGSLKRSSGRTVGPIGAEVSAVALLGPAAIEALAEIELGSAAELRAPAGPYPRAVIRIALADRLCRRLALGAPALGPEFAFDAHTEEASIKELVGSLDAVVNALVAPLPDGLGTLPSLTIIDLPDGFDVLVDVTDEGVRDHLLHSHRGHLSVRAISSWSSSTPRPRRQCPMPPSRSSHSTMRW